MKLEYSTKEAAKTALSKIQKIRYNQITKSGHQILKDNSFVHPDFKWEHHNTTLPYSQQTNEIIWTYKLLITTDQLIKDLNNI